MTMPSVCIDETHCPPVLDWVEFGAVIIFTIEYFMRLYAAPEAYPVRHDCSNVPYFIFFMEHGIGIEIGIEIDSDIFLLPTYAVEHYYSVD